MTAPNVGAARIEITGDLDEFARQSSADLRRALGQMDGQINRQLTGQADDYRRAGDRAGSGYEQALQRQLNDLRQVGEHAGRDLTTGVRAGADGGMGAVRADVDTHLRRVSDDTSEAGRRAGSGFGSRLRSTVSAGTGGLRASVSEQMRGIGGIVAGAFAVDKIKDFLGDAMDEARESQKVGAQTSATVKATGEAAGVTSDQIGNLATQISNYAGIDDEAIQSGENLLLNFKNIHNSAGDNNDIFSHATKIATDLSVATGTSLTGAMRTIGKALNDPTKGMSGLTKAGITFTQGQKDIIKRMVETGDTLNAQKILLHALDDRYKGSAAAQATSADKAGVAWGNLKEQVGTALIPILDKLENFITKTLIPAFSNLFNWIETHQQVVQNIAIAVGALFAAFAAYKVITMVRDAMLALNLAMEANPMILLATAVVGIGVALYMAYRRFKPFRDAVDALGRGLRAVWQGVLQPVVDFFRDHWRGALQIAVAVFAPFIALPLVIIRHWQGIVSFFAGIPHAIASFFSGAASWLFNAGKAIVVGLWNGVQSFVGTVLGFFADLPGHIWDLLSGMYDQMLSLGKNLLTGIWNGIAALSGWLWDKVKGFCEDLWNGILDFFGIASPSKRAQREVGAQIVAGIVVGLNQGTPAGVRAAVNMARSIGDVTKSSAKETKAYLVAAMSDLGQQLGTQLDNARSKLADARQAYRDTVTSISGNIVGGANIADAGTYTDKAGTEQVGNVGLIQKQYADKVAAAEKFTRQLTRLKRMGLDSSLVDQFAEAGVEGAGGQVNELATKASKGNIRYLNAQQEKLAAVAHRAGVVTAEAMNRAGVNAALGLVNGIKSHEKDLIAVATAMGTAMVRALKKSLRINSPSGVMADEVGAMVPRGMALGIDNDTHHVEKAMRRLGDKARTSINGAGAGVATSIDIGNSGASVVRLADADRQLLHHFATAGHTLVLPDQTVIARTANDGNRKLGRRL